MTYFLHLYLTVEFKNRMMDFVKKNKCFHTVFKTQVNGLLKNGKCRRMSSLLSVHLRFVSGLVINLYISLSFVSVLGAW
jgi:hypothetical protein